MPTHAAFLRAVNLGATRKASSAQLRAAFESAGFEDVATFRNSGNVVFSASGAAAKITSAAERALEAELGFAVPAFVRTRKQLERIAAHEPFPRGAAERSRGKLQVALLAAKPKAAAARQVLELASDDDLLDLDGTELYWLPSGGTQQSNLGMKAIDGALGPNTLRTHGTISQLLAKFFD